MKAIQPEKRQVDIGCLQLTDSAPFFVARQQGFFAEQNLDAHLYLEVSWASVRDKLATGRLDAAQMLAPLPAMSTLGVSGVRAPMLSGLVLSTGGNGITIEKALAQQARQRVRDAAAPSYPRALAELARERGGTLTFATVHAFSSHTLLLRRWLSEGGVDPDRDAKMIVAPPSQVGDCLSQGVVDGFCVGEPWNSIAEQVGIAEIIAVDREIWPDLPEKVLAVSEDWHDRYPETHKALRLALLRACRWLSDGRNRDQASVIMSQPDALDLSITKLRPTLSGLPMQAGAPYPQFYHENLNRPDLAKTREVIRDSLQLLGKSLSSELIDGLAARCARPELFDELEEASLATA